MGKSSFAGELRQIGDENDPALFFQGLLAFADRVRDAGDLGSATELYAAIAAASETGSEPIAATQARAQARLDALLGKGSFGGRFEVLAERFVRDATDYRMIVPMIAGSVVFQSVRAAGLGRLLSNSSAAWHRRGLGARFSAGLLGYAAEVPVFAFSSRALRDLGGEKVPWDSGNIVKDLATAAITLGALKGSAYLGQRALPSAPGRGGLAQKLSQAALPQASMFVGLMAAHKLEAGLGLRPHLDGATTVTDTLASMLSLGVGSRIGHRMLGESFANFQRSLNQRALEASVSPSRLETSRSLAWQASLGHGGSLGSPVEALPRPSVYQASSIEGKGKTSSSTAKASAEAPARQGAALGSESSDPSRGDGLRLRPYQGEYLQSAVDAMRRAAKRGALDQASVSIDRGYILSPFQTGKSLIIGPLAEAARGIFPGKKTLVLSPLKIVQAQVVHDLAKTFSGRVTVFDGKEKNLDGDVVVASVFSLVKLFDKAPEVRARFQADQFGLVVVDELTHVLANSWQRILTELGFVDAEGGVTPSRNKFVLGLGGTGEREDGRHVREFFGNTFLAGRGLNWFIQEGYLHRVYGLEVPYGRSLEDSERVEDGPETLVAMRNTPENRRRILDTYEQYLGGKKAMVFVQSIQAAEDLAKDFETRLGPGYAVAVTRDTSDREVDRHVGQFTESGALKVLVSVRRLAASFRAVGAHGVIHGYQTASWNLFAQRSSRPLARQDGEAQRDVLIITMEGKVMPLQRAQTAATLLGDYRKSPSDRVYRPGELGAGEKDRPAPKPGRVRQGLLATTTSEPVKSLQIAADFFPQQVREALHDQFGGDVLRMAEQAQLRLAECDALLHGVLPETYLEVVHLAERLGLSFPRLTEAWLNDKSALLEATYPLRTEMGEAQRNLTRLFRRAVLLQAGRDSLLSLVEHGSVSKHQYGTLRNHFKGNFSTHLPSLKELHQWLVDSGVADAIVIRNAIGAFVAERALASKDRAVTEAEPNEADFEPNYLDALDVEGNVKISSLWGAGQRWASGDGETPIERLDVEKLEATVATLSAKFSEKEWEVLRMRYGFGGETTATYEGIGGKLNLSPERSRQIELGALRELRHPLVSRRLLPFYHDAPEGAGTSKAWEGDMDLPLRSLGISSVTQRLLAEYGITKVGDLTALPPTFFNWFGRNWWFVVRDINQVYSRLGWEPLANVSLRQSSATYFKQYQPLVLEVEGGDRESWRVLLNTLRGIPQARIPILMRMLSLRRPELTLDTVLFLRDIELPSDHHLWEIAQEYILADIANLAPRYPRGMTWTGWKEANKKILESGTLRDPRLLLALKVLAEQGLPEAKLLWEAFSPEVFSLSVPSRSKEANSLSMYWENAVRKKLADMSWAKGVWKTALLVSASQKYPNPFPPVLVERQPGYGNIAFSKDTFPNLEKALVSFGFTRSEVGSTVHFKLSLRE